MKVDLSYFKTPNFWKDIIAITLGLLISAAGVYYFLLPSKFVLGSISGLAMVVETLLAGIGITIKVSNLILLFNAFLIIIALIFLGKEVGVKTIIASLLLGPFMNLWEWILPYEKLIEPGMTSVMGDPVFDLLGFIILIGASQAFLFKINASTGGIDIIALIMQKYLKMDIGTAVSISGIAVCCTGFFIHPFRMVAMGIMATWVNGMIVDHFTSSLNKRKRVCIISPEHEKIREYIINNLHRGCTLYNAKGGYTGEDEVEIQALLTQREFSALMEYIKLQDFKAFATAGNCSEVFGLWRPSSSKKK